MNVSCVLKASEVDGVMPDLMVFPEGVDRREVVEARRLRPHALIVGAITTENNRSRGFLVHGRQRYIDYLKAAGDGRTEGSGPPKRLPMCELGHVAIGVVVCMDINEPFAQDVFQRMRSSKCMVRVLCVPADMGDYWFSGPSVSGARWEGVHVVLCNHTKTHFQSRCKSFVTNTTGIKTSQKNAGPLHVKLRGGSVTVVSVDASL